MKKVVKSYTINSKIYELFQIYCIMNKTNVSTEIEKMMKEKLKEAK